MFFTDRFVWVPERFAVDQLTFGMKSSHCARFWRASSAEKYLVRVQCFFKCGSLSASLLLTSSYSSFFMFFHLNSFFSLAALHSLPLALNSSTPFRRVVHVCHVWSGRSSFLSIVLKLIGMSFWKVRFFFVNWESVLTLVCDSVLTLLFNSRSHASFQFSR